MNPAVHQLVNPITGKSSLGECSTGELEQLVSQYPYFGPAQFLLARKLKEEDSPQYEVQSQKALLYFPDHLWYAYLCGDNGGEGTIIPAITGESSGEQTPVSIEEGTDRETVAPPVHAPGEIIIPETKLTGPLISQDAAPAREGQEPGGGAAGLPELKSEPARVPETTLLFEPYHTVDYFASQGIRSTENEKPADRFTQQLKSFTEWLKAMKRLPEADTTVRPAASDQKVEQMAEHSIADREVITEAMADVWEKQGNREKAIATYRKLSLLNPAKSAYFAAKIEYLKHP